MGLPVFWLIAPQVWAWGPWRIGGLRRKIDRLGTILPFETEFFTERGFDVFPQQVKSGDFDYDLAANAEGVGNLMTRCRGAKAFLHFSSTAVYEYAEPITDRGFTFMDTPANEYDPHFSPDGRWLAWSRAVEARNSAVFLFDTTSGATARRVCRTSRKMPSTRNRTTRRFSYGSM